MIAAIRIVPIALHLVRWNPQPFSIFSATSIDIVFLHPNFCRIAIGFIAARPCWLIGHIPRRVELLVDWQIGNGMTAMFLRVRCQAKSADKKTGRDTSWAPPVEGTSTRHSLVKEIRLIRKQAF